MTQIGCLKFSAASRVPTASPASFSFEPKWVNAPSCVETILAGVEADHRDAGVGGLLQGVLEGIRLGERDRDAVDLLVDGLLDELGLAAGFGVGRVEELDIVLRRAASSAPLRTMSQKVSPAAAWVIIAILIRGVVATCPPPAALPVSAGLPPVLEQALRASIGTTAATSAAFRQENFATINLL